MKRLLIDLSYIASPQKARESVAIYAFRFLETIKTSQLPFKADLLVSEDMVPYFRERFPQFEIVVYPSISKKIQRIPYIKGILKMIKWKRFVNRLDYDAIYVPFSWSGNSLSTKAKKIITIHDLRPMRNLGRTFTDKWWFKFLNLDKIYLATSKYFYTRHCINSTKTIGISNYVADDLKSVWPKCADKVVTIYNGVTLSKEESAPISCLVNEQFILYVNTLVEYKNIITLIKAFAIIRENHPNLKIAVVGKATDYWTTVVKPEISRLGIDNNIVHLTYLSNQELLWAYKNARIFVTTSIHEGFGYTPIEAAMCETPVISSRCESLPDVTAEKVYYYAPPMDYKNLGTLMNDILENYPSHEKMIEIATFFQNRYDQIKQSKEIITLINDCI